jgi:hypothetical protein
MSGLRLNLTDQFRSYPYEENASPVFSIDLFDLFSEWVYNSDENASW